MKNILILIGCVLGCVGVGALSGFSTVAGLETWYPTAVKPSFNPPNWIFAPVWTLLYAMMGASTFLVWKNAGVQKKAFILFFIQLALNFFWSFLFFYFNQLGLALIEIIILWGFILATILSFSKHSKTAAYLLVPYLLWVSFATVLTVAFYQLN